MSTLDYFWTIWETDYLQLLRQQSISRRHHQHSTTDRTPKVGEVVIVKIEGQPRATWQLGRVTDVVRSRDNLVRSARVLMPNKRILNRPVNLLYPLELHRHQRRGQALLTYTWPFSSCNKTMYLLCCR